MQENINIGVGCEVRECRFNVEGCHCALDKIHVGCSCGDTCTCCDSFVERE